MQLDTVKQFALEQDLPRVFERAEEGVSVLKFGPELMQELPGRSLDDILYSDGDFFHQLMGFWCGFAVSIDGKLVESPYPIRWGPSVTIKPMSRISDFIRMKDIAAVEAIRFPGNKVHEPWIPHSNMSAKCSHMVLIWTKGFKQKQYKGR